MSEQPNPTSEYSDVVLRNGRVDPVVTYRRRVVHVDCDSVDGRSLAQVAASLRTLAAYLETLPGTEYRGERVVALSFWSGDDGETSDWISCTLQGKEV